MPITFQIATHSSETFDTSGWHSFTVEKPEDVLRMTWEPGTETYNSETQSFSGLSCKDLIQSSLQESAELKNFFPQNNGFLQGIITAYNGHHNLVIRPDDVWIAILSQFNLYVNANAEALRSKFVSHQGKEKITVRCVAPSRYDVDYKWMADEMTKQMKDKAVDPELHGFIIPNFSTTTPVDTTIGCVMMMSTLQKYFSYETVLMCGIPSVTLLGTKQDYEDIYRRLDKLDSFGEEPRVFAALLRPVIREFVEAFNSASAQANLEFWSRICHYRAGGSGPSYLSGWATAFCVWGKKGNWQGPKLETFASPISEEERLESERYYVSDGLGFSFSAPPALFFGDLRFPVVELSKIPNGYCEVDVRIDEFGTEYECMMVAGHVGFVVSGERSDTIQPSPQWFLFEKEESSR